MRRGGGAKQCGSGGSPPERTNERDQHTPPSTPRNGSTPLRPPPTPPIPFPLLLLSTRPPSSSSSSESSYNASPKPHQYPILTTTAATTNKNERKHRPLHDALARTVSRTGKSGSRSRCRWGWERWGVERRVRRWDREGRGRWRGNGREATGGGSVCGSEEDGDLWVRCGFAFSIA